MITKARKLYTTLRNLKLFQETEDLIIKIVSLECLLFLYSLQYKIIQRIKSKARSVIINTNSLDVSERALAANAKQEYCIELISHSSTETIDPLLLSASPP